MSSKVATGSGEFTNEFFTTFLDQVLTLLEKVSDEEFWKSIVSERLLELLKRYFGSDVVFLGIILYISPIVSQYINYFFTLITNAITEKLYVSIQISKDESGYDAIQDFIASQSSVNRKLRDAEGRFIDDSDDEDGISESSTPKLHLYPLAEQEQKIKYKKHTLWVVKKKQSASGPKMPDWFYGDSLKDVFGLMSQNPCIQISMRGQNLDLLKEIIQEWTDEHFKRDKEKLSIYKYLPSHYDGFTWRTIGTKDIIRSMDSVVLKQGQKEHLIKDIQIFKRRQAWYTARGIPYRRGYLLYGPPGTGKTSIVQSIASKSNMNIAIMSLSGKMTDDNFNLALEDLPRNSILLMEDIDHCILKKGEKDEGATKVTMNALLNAFDGVAAPEGSMVFMTCNDINRVQPALLRPGRIDVKMELGYADEEQIRLMFWRFMDFTDDNSQKTKEKSIDEKEALRLKEKKEELSRVANKFTSMIPKMQVTPAELQNFFIMNLMEHEDYEERTDNKFDFILEKVPDFLKSVRRDREQALDYESGVSFTVKAINQSMALQDPANNSEDDSSSKSSETLVDVAA